MGEVQASQVVVGEGDGQMRSKCRRGEIVNFLFSSPTSTLGVSLSGQARASSRSETIMDHLDISCRGSVVIEPFIGRVRVWAINNIPP